MTWNFDVTSICRDGRKIWIETAKGEVLITWFARKSPHNRKGGFVNVRSEDEIVAWQPYVVPAPSGIGRRMLVTRQNLDFLPIIEDVGGI
jgi:hypothetical protein